MQPNKIDSVYGYLTPKRILTNLMNPNQKSKVNRSMTDSLHSPGNIDQSTIQNQTPKRERQSYKKKSGGYEENQVSQDNDNFILQRKSNISNKDNKNNDSKRFTSNPSAPIIKSNNVDHKNGDEYEPKQPSSRVSRNNNHSERNDEQNPAERQPSYKKKPIQQQQLNPNPSKQSSTSKRMFSGSGTKNNPQINRIVIQQTINRLISVKCSLQQQIAELKVLLDNTSQTLENMDVQFEKVKQAILVHTSRALDSAFKQYKKSLPNWAIYQNIQQEGLTKIAQINQAIQICESEQKLKVFGGKQAMQKKLQQYKLLVLQVKDARNQCYSQRPMISEQKIKKLQSALKQIGQF